MDRPYALYAGYCLVGERLGLSLFITALVGFIPGSIAGGFHLICIQSAIWLRSIFANSYTEYGAKNNNILKAHNF